VAAEVAAVPAKHLAAVRAYLQACITRDYSLPDGVTEALQAEFVALRKADKTFGPEHFQTRLTVREKASVQFDVRIVSIHDCSQRIMLKAHRWQDRWRGHAVCLTGLSLGEFVRLSISHEGTNCGFLGITATPCCVHSWRGSTR
jgi:hypothetical protein